jgi:hypothetical protein
MWLRNRAGKRRPMKRLAGCRWRWVPRTRSSRNHSHLSRRVPSVVAGSGQPGTQCHTQRYRPTRSHDRPEQCSFSIAFGEPLAVQLALRYAKHRGPQADHRAEHSHSMTQFPQFSQKLGLPSPQKTTRADIGDAPVKPASNGRLSDLQLGKQVRIADFPDHFSNAVVGGASSAEGRHHSRIGRPSNRGRS